MIEVGKVRYKDEWKKEVVYTFQIIFIYTGCHIREAVCNHLLPVFKSHFSEYTLVPPMFCIAPWFSAT